MPSPQPSFVRASFDAPAASARCVRHLCRLIFASLLACGISTLVAQSDATPSPPRVLIINSYHPGYNWSDGEQTGLLHAMIQARPNLLPRIEYLDWRRFPKAARAPAFLDQLEQKYGRRAFDLIIALDDPAVDLVLAHRETFGPEVPVVFGGVNDSDADHFRQYPRVTGVMQTYDFGGTLGLIHQVQPDARRIIAVHCHTESGLATRRAFEQFLAEHPQPFTIDWCENWTAAELLQRVGAAPRQSAILLLSIFSDRNGRVLTDDESFGRTLTERSAAPIYFLAPPMVKHFGGNAWETATWQGIGGSLMAADLHGELVAQLALRVLNGEPISGIPIVLDSPSRLAVDYRQLDRFGLADARLPSGTTVYHSPISFYQINRTRIIVGLVISALLAVTVVVLIAFIWQRRRGELALRRSNAHFQLIARATNDAVWDWDLVSGAMWWNEGYIQQLQLPPATPPSYLAWEEHLHPEDRAAVAQKLRNTIHTGEEHSAIEYRVVRRDGGVRHVLDRIFFERLGDGSPLRLLGARLDLTDRQLAEQEQRRLAAAVEQSAEAIFLVNPDGSITYTNPAFTLITGHPAPASLKQLYACLQCSPAEPLAFQTIREEVRQRGRWTTRIEGVKLDGTSCLLQADITPIRSASHEIVSYVLVGQDITRETRLEDQVRLAQKMKAVGQLAGGIAHDFNNLLQIVTSCAAHAQTATSPEERDDCLRQIRETTTQAAQLTRQLLVFSRNEPPQFKPLDLNQLLSNQLRLLRRLLGARIQVDFRPAAPALAVQGDQGQLEQVFMNLCINARDAMPDGGRIALELDEVRLDEPFATSHPWARPGHFMRISVTDHGCGMDKATLTRIFDPFFTTKSKDKGTGLGLAVVYGIVEKHGGFLHVYSEPGLGTTFRIYLPIQIGSSPPSTLPVATAPAPAPTQDPGTILLAEDEPAVRQIALRLLKRGGHQVIVAQDGTEAETLFHAHVGEIELAILDSVMPGKTGQELVKLFHTVSPRLPVLLCSGYGASVGPEITDSPHLVRHLAKPYDPGEMLKLVSELLATRRAAAPDPAPPA